MKKLLIILSACFITTGFADMNTTTNTLCNDELKGFHSGPVKNGIPDKAKCIPKGPTIPSEFTQCNIIGKGEKAKVYFQLGNIYCKCDYTAKEMGFSLANCKKVVW